MQEKQPYSKSNCFNIVASSKAFIKFSTFIFIFSTQLWINGLCIQVFLDLEIIKPLFLWCIQVKYSKLDWLGFTSTSTFHRLYQIVLFSSQFSDNKYLWGYYGDLQGTRCLLLTPGYNFEEIFLSIPKIMAPRKLSPCN